MNQKKILNRIEELRREESEIWLNLDPHEIANQILGKPLSEATAQKIAHAGELRYKITKLDHALQKAIRSATPITPPIEVPLH